MRTQKLNLNLTLEDILRERARRGPQVESLSLGEQIEHCADWISRNCYLQDPSSPTPILFALYDYQKESIATLLRYWEEKRPIPWIKVHDLADFAYFDHSRHLTEKAGLECADCHGPVETMDRVRRVESLKMSWCLDCHMEPPPEDAPPGQTTRAPIHCSTCHR